MRKMISVLALALCLTFALGSVATAATPPTISPQWNTTSSCTPAFRIIGSTANCALSVTTAHNTDKITATLLLQKADSEGEYTNTIKTWSKLTATKSLSFSDTYSPISSGKYRLKAIVYVNGSSGNDTITDFVYQTKK